MAANQTPGDAYHDTALVRDSMMTRFPPHQFPEIVAQGFFPQHDRGVSNLSAIRDSYYCSRPLMALDDAPEGTLPPPPELIRESTSFYHEDKDDGMHPMVDDDPMEVDGVIMRPGFATFSREGETIIEAGDHAMQQQIFDRLPIHDRARITRDGRVVSHQRRDFFEFLKREQDELRRSSQGAEQGVDGSSQAPYGTFNGSQIDVHSPTGYGQGAMGDQ